MRVLLCIHTYKKEIVFYVLFLRHLPEMFRGDACLTLESGMENLAVPIPTHLANNLHIAIHVAFIRQQTQSFIYAIMVEQGRKGLLQIIVDDMRVNNHPKVYRHCH